MSDKSRDLLDLTSLQLKAKPPEGAKRPAALSVKTWNNKVSMSVFTNVDGLPRHGIIGANLYPYDFMTFLTLLEDIANSTYVEGERVTRKMAIYDKPGNDRNKIVDLVAGRDAEGVMYICVVSPKSEFPKVPFKIEPPRTAELEGLSKVEASKLATIGRVNWWRQIIPQYLLNNFVDEKNNNNGGGGYNNRSSSVTDDDMPF